MAIGIVSMVMGLVTIMLVLINAGKRNPQSRLNTPVPNEISLILGIILVLFIILFIVWLFKQYDKY